MGFKCSEHLKEHAAMHSDDRPFHCSTPGCPAVKMRNVTCISQLFVYFDCYQKYKISPNLRRHERACRIGALKSRILAVIPEEVGGLKYYRRSNVAEKMAKRVSQV